MEKVDVRFLISSFNKMPYGISVSLIRALRHLDNLGFKLNFDKFRECLKNLELFYKTDNLEQYVYYVLRTSIEVAPAPLSFNTDYALLRSNCKRFSGMLITLDEVSYMQKIYKEFVDNAVNNFLEHKNIFPVEVEIDKEEIKDLYPEIKGEKRKFDRFIESFTTFFVYNGFVLCNLKVIFLNSKDKNRLTFFEYEKSNMKSSIIKEDDE